MTIELLPTNFDDLVSCAVRTFWLTRRGSTNASQGGTRGSVISGKNMDGFIELVRAVTRHCGLPEESIHTRKRDVVLPGYFRATKDWDVLVIYKQRLLAVLEFKSQVGSFGNNFNNRTEEAIGAAADLWAADRHGAFRRADQQHWQSVAETTEAWAQERSAPHTDPRPPFLGWLMLLEDCKGSSSPVSVKQPHYSVLKEFQGASYAMRYRLLCEKLMSRRLYSGAALLLSNSEEGANQGRYRSMSESTNVNAVFRDFAARMAAAVE